MITISNTVFKGRSIVRQLAAAVVSLNEEWGDLNTGAPLITVDWGDLNTDRQLIEESWGVAAPPAPAPTFNPPPGEDFGLQNATVSSSVPVTWTWTLSDGPNYTIFPQNGITSPYYGTEVSFTIGDFNTYQQQFGDVNLTATDDSGNTFSWFLGLTGANIG